MKWVAILGVAIASAVLMGRALAIHSAPELLSLERGPAQIEPLISIQEQPLLNVSRRQKVRPIQRARPEKILILSARTLPVGEDKGGKWQIAPETTERLVRVVLGKQRLRVYEEGRLKYTFICSTSVTGLALPDEKKTEEPHDHVGVFAVLEKEENHFSRQHLVDMPYAIRYHGGHYIHATHEIAQLGSRASHGCVRLHPRDAKALYAWIQIGDPIEIR